MNKDRQIDRNYKKGKNAKLILLNSKGKYLEWKLKCKNDKDFIK